MTRMAEPERPRDDHEYDDERFEDEGRRSIFSALWFRAILVVIVLGVVAAVAVPYVLELANQPAPKTAVLSKPEMPAMSTAVAPSAPPVASAPAPSAPAPEKSATPEKLVVAEKPAASEGAASAPTPMTPATDTPASPAPKKPESSKPAVASKSGAPKEPGAARAPRAAAASSPSGASGDYFVQVGAFKNPDTAKKLAVRLREQKYNVEETSASGVKPARSASPSAPPASAPAAATDRYDVHVSGGAPADINANLSEPGAAGARCGRAAQHAAARCGRALEGSRGRWPQGAGPSRPGRLGAAARAGRREQRSGRDERRHPVSRARRSVRGQVHRDVDPPRAGAKGLLGLHRARRAVTAGDAPAHRAASPGGGDFQP